MVLYTSRRERATKEIEKSSEKDLTKSQRCDIIKRSPQRGRTRKNHKAAPDGAKAPWADKACNSKSFPSDFGKRFCQLLEFHNNKFDSVNLEWNEQRLLKWATEIGPNTEEVIKRLFDSSVIREQAILPAISVLKLFLRKKDQEMYAYTALFTAMIITMESCTISDAIPTDTMLADVFPSSLIPSLPIVKFLAFER